MIRFVLVPALLLFSLSATAERTYLEVSPHDQEDLQSLLTTVESSHQGGMPTADPIVVILHGQEAFSFVRSNYAQNKSLVDHAARLDAYELIDVRICETWMNSNGVQREDLPAFIDTVPYAPEEIRRLEAEGYAPYDSVNI